METCLELSLACTCCFVAKRQPCPVSSLPLPLIQVLQVPQNLFLIKITKNTYLWLQASTAPSKSVLFWTPFYKKEIEVLQHVQTSTRELVEVLEHSFYEKELRELDEEKALELSLPLPVPLERELWRRKMSQGNLISLCNSPERRW